MTKFYSKSTGGFYSTEIHGDNMPADSVEIPDEQHAYLLEQQSAGLVIQGDADGMPVALPPPERPLDALQAQAQARIDAHYETLYFRNVPNSAIGAEYDAAYIVAKEWMKNTANPAPERVKALAESYGITNEQAAQVVIAKWTEAQAVAFDQRGAARLRANLAVRNATTPAAVAAAEADGKAAMEAVVFSI